MNRGEQSTMTELWDRIARPSPVWAGGSAVALTCASAWALLEMVAGLALRRNQEAAAVLATVIERAQAARTHLLALARDDADAVRQALRNAPLGPENGLITVPLQISAWASEGIKTAQIPELVSYVPAKLDLLAARTLFGATWQISSTLVRENAQLLSQADQETVQNRLAELAARNKA